MITLSIIIPHFNIPYLLKRLLVTIPKRENLQVIVVDDCSTNNLTNLEDLKKEYDWVEWYSTKLNGGGGKARNIGLDYAKGNYILFADADDYFTPNLAKILEKDILKKNTDLIFFDINTESCDKGKKSVRSNQVNKAFKLLEKSRNKSESIMRYLHGEPWGKFIKRELIKQNNIKFDETRIHNDTTFSYLVGYFADSVNFINEKLYCVTDRANSVSKLVNKDKLIIRTEIFSKKFLFFKKNNIKIYDPILFSSIFISLLKFDFNLINRINKIYKKYNITNKEKIIGLIKAFLYYISKQNLIK